MDTPRIKLRELIDQIQGCSAEYSTFFDRQTGEIISVESSLIHDADSDEDETELDSEPDTDLDSEPDAEGDTESNTEVHDADDANHPLRAVPEWQRQEVELARLISRTSSRFLPLPDQFDAHEWEMMAKFASRVKDDHASDQLQSAIRGSGAFRRFKDAAARLGLLDEWYRFQDDQYRELAVGWCNEHGLAWEEE